MNELQVCWEQIEALELRNGQLERTIQNLRNEVNKHKKRNDRLVEWFLHSSYGWDEDEPK